LRLDTNILRRYYVDDATDEHTAAQRSAARTLIESGEPLAVCRTVLLELEWVLRGYYKLTADQVQSVLQHLLALPHVVFDDRDVLVRAMQNFAAGLDFADALHHASYAHCQRVASFDDRGFARRSDRLKLQPRVVVP